MAGPGPDLRDAQHPAGVEFDEMFQSTDLALYEAKRSGRNRVAYGATTDAAPTVIVAA